MTSEGKNCGIVAMEKDAVYRKAPPRQVGHPFQCRVPCNSPFGESPKAFLGTGGTTLWLPSDSNRLRMLIGMARLHNSVKGSLAGRTFSRFFRFGVLPGLRSIEINPEDFRHQLAKQNHLLGSKFAGLEDHP